MSRQESLPLGVIVERRDVDNPWQDHVWQPVAVVPGAPPLDGEGEWRLIQEGEGWAHYHVATLDLEVFAGETEGYKTNLASGQPAVFVVLTPGEEADDPEVIPLLVTACPYEAGDYLEDSEVVVEGVEMPDEVAAWLHEFVEKHHVERAFKKRKRRAYDPRKGDMRPRPLVETD